MHSPQLYCPVLQLCCTVLSSLQAGWDALTASGGGQTTAPPDACAVPGNRVFLHLLQADVQV